MCADEVWSSGLKPHVLVNEKREFDAAAGRVFTESPLPRGAQLATNEQKAVKTCISLGEKWLRMKRIKMKFKKKVYGAERKDMDILWMGHVHKLHTQSSGTPEGGGEKCERDVFLF